MGKVLYNNDMKNLISLMTAAVALNVMALDVTLDLNGDVRVGKGGASLAMAIHHEGWVGTTHGQNVSFTFPDERTKTVSVEFRRNHSDLYARGTSQLLAVPQGAQLMAQLTSTREQRPEDVVLALELPLDMIGGGRWSDSSGAFGVFAPNWDGQTVHVMSRSITSFTVNPPKGEAFTLSFPQSTSVMLQDNRRWGKSFTLRIHAPGGDRHDFNPGTTRKFVCTIAGEKSTRVSTAHPVVVKEGPEWVKLDYQKNIVAGSALDFSTQGFLDAPAGKYGWLKNENGHFVFERLPNKPQRFYGVNLCFDAAFPDREMADELVTRLARLGYNTVRIHHYESRNGVVKGSPDHLSINAERTRRLDYLLAKCFEKGIYVTTDLFTCREVMWREIGIDRDGHLDKQVYKNLIAVHEPAYQNFCTFAKKFLTHVNPYTGRAYKDEPALPLISLINENSLHWCWDRIRVEEPLKLAWKKWLAARRAKDASFAAGVSDDAANVRDGQVVDQFMSDLEAKLVVRLRAFLRGLGAKALLTNQNCSGTGENMAATRRNCYDYVDNHFYVDHPQFLVRSWSLPSKCNNGNPVLSKRLAPVSVAQTRQKGMPFTVTEWNFSGPGMFRGVGGIMTGAVAALQDWDGLWRFAYSHSDSGLKDRTGSPGYFDVATDPLGQAGDRASICLFLRGDLPAVGMDADVTASPAFSLDRSRGSFALDTPKTAGGFTPSGRLAAGVVAFDAGDVATTLWASSVDGRPLASSHRILVTHLTDVQANGNLYADEEKRVLLKWGAYPPVVRDGRARVELSVASPAAFTVWALETTGRRLAKVPSRVIDGKLVFTANIRGPQDACLLYELAR